MKHLFKIPVDLMIEMKREFPDIKNIDQIIDKLFEKIVKKTLTDGSCAVMRLGTFFSYKTNSNRLHKMVPRFKFSVSRSLRTKLAQDTYILDQIPETRETAPRVDLIIEENKKIKQTRRPGRRKKIKSPQDEISAILDERFYNNNNDEQPS